MFLVHTIGNTLHKITKQNNARRLPPNEPSEHASYEEENIVI
jgi:hypothetical protein